MRVWLALIAHLTNSLLAFGCGLPRCVSVSVWSACDLFAASVWLRANPKEHIGTRWPTTEGLIDTIQEAVAQNRQCEPIGGSKVGREFRIDVPAVGPRRAEHNVVAYGQA